MNDALRAIRARASSEGRAIVRERDQFGYVLGLIVVTIILRAWAGDTSLGIFLSVALGGLTLAFILHTCGVHRRLLVAVETFIVFAIIVSGLGILVGSANDGHQIAGIFGIAIAFGAPIAIVRRIGVAPVITFRVVLGALAIYLLFGLAYSYLYAFVPWLQGKPFFVQTDAPTSTIYLYFSYITMATVGYGDFTPATDLGKMLAVSQALLGQLYLVSVVAVIVGNIGQVRRPIGTVAPRLAPAQADADRGPDAGDGAVTPAARDAASAADAAEASPDGAPAT
jgi:hypothetical protein